MRVLVAIALLVFSSGAIVAQDEDPATNQNVAGVTQTLTTNANFLGSAARLPEPSIVVFQELDWTKKQELVEDLQTLNYLLAQARPDTKSSRVALGINVADANSGSSAEYVEGFGVIFSFSVPFALVEGDGASGDSQAKTESPSEWEQARSALFDNTRVLGYTARGTFSRAAYDEGLVSEYRDNLVQALLQARNLRNIGDDQTIAVIAKGPEHNSFGTTNDGRLTQFIIASATPARRSVLAITAKMGDLTGASEDDIASRVKTRFFVE